MITGGSNVKREDVDDDCIVFVGVGWEVTGRSPCHSTQYSVLATSELHGAPGLKLMNSASVILHSSARDLQVSPCLAGQVNEQSLGRSTRALMQDAPR